MQSMTSHQKCSSSHPVHCASPLSTRGRDQGNRTDSGRPSQFPKNRPSWGNHLDWMSRWKRSVHTVSRSLRRSLLRPTTPVHLFSLKVYIYVGRECGPSWYRQLGRMFPRSWRPSLTTWIFRICIMSSGRFWRHTVIYVNQDLRSDIRSSSNGQSGSIRLELCGAYDLIYSLFCNREEIFRNELFCPGFDW